MRHSRPPKAASNRAVWIERNEQLARQAVARPAGNDGQRRVAERQHRRHLVDGAVAAPRHDRASRLGRARRAASSRAWPERSVMKTSASRPRAAISAAARSARSRATSIRPPVPEIGLMMTAIGREHDYFLESPRRTFGVTNQLSAPARRDVRLSTSIRQTPPFLNVERAAGADEMRGQLAEPGLVADERDAAPPGRARELRQHRGRRMSRRQRVEHLDGGLARQAGRENVGGLLGADERAREDLVDHDVEPRQAV